MQFSYSWRRLFAFLTIAKVSLLNLLSFPLDENGQPQLKAQVKRNFMWSSHITFPAPVNAIQDAQLWQIALDAFGEIDADMVRSFSPYLNPLRGANLRTDSIYYPRSQEQQSKRPNRIGIWQ